MGAETSIAAQGFGIGTSAVGAYFNAQGQKSTLNAQADLDDTNAKLQDMNAQSAILSGQRQEQAVDLNTAQLKSSQRASMAANGVDLSSETPVNVLTSTDVVGQVDAATVAANASRTAFGYQIQKTNLLNKARGERTTADAISPFTSGVTSLISGAGSVADSWYKFKKEGAFDSKSQKAGPLDDWLSRQIGDNLVSRALF